MYPFRQIFIGTHRRPRNERVQTFIVKNLQQQSRRPWLTKICVGVLLISLRAILSNCKSS